ncbi:hypothetical protein QGN29_04410 [Temperatibacter marinus]|uniref:Uncharacterized protein n=1 Tax=Temperatibacter marinus TaxID=1456591 RepID=A0AA52EF67_9PROT|nr:hypothetical protein [Temperatibacter marinus]WND03615.1 hypothetical protein QGN29_04410 [Temperatibacter marinus]
MRTFILMSIFILFTAPLYGADVALKAYIQGDLTRAIELAKQSQDMEEQFLECKITMVQSGLYGAYKDYKSEIDRITSICESFHEKYPQHFNGRLSVAMSYALKSKIYSSASLAKKSKKMFEEIVDKYPNNPEALGALATWHSEIDRAGFFVRMALGGSKKKADKLFAKAVTLGDFSLPLQIKYLNYLAYGKKREAAEVLAKKIAAKAPVEPYEIFMQSQASKIITAMRTGKKKKLMKAMAAATAFAKTEKDG